MASHSEPLNFLPIYHLPLDGIWSVLCLLTSLHVLLFSWTHKTTAQDPYDHIFHLLLFIGGCAWWTEIVQHYTWETQVNNGLSHNAEPSSTWPQSLDDLVSDFIEKIQVTAQVCPQMTTLYTANASYFLPSYLLLGYLHKRGSFLLKRIISPTLAFSFSGPAVRHVGSQILVADQGWTTPAIETQIINHWATREVPSLL